MTDKYTTDSRELCDKAYVKLFCESPYAHNGLKEAPSSAYQLMVSALEFIRWELDGEDRETIKQAVGICERLRDEQKRREWNRAAE